MPANAKAPKVSIGVAVYNGEQFLRQTLDALLAQTFRDFELIICDNCSSDRTEEICRVYAAADSRIRYHRNSSNIGAPRNFNLAFTLSTGEFFKWSGADDICAPEFVEHCLAALEEEPNAVLAYPKTTWIDENGVLVQEYEDHLNLPFPAPHQRFNYLLWNIRQCNANFGLTRSATMKKTRLFGTFPNSDLPYLAEMSLRGKFIEVPEALFSRRVHSLSVHKYPTAQERMAMFDPGRVRKLGFPNWRLLGAYLSAIHRVPVGFMERLRCYACMRTWVRRWGVTLWQDVTDASLALVSRSGSTAVRNP